MNFNVNNVNTMQILTLRFLAVIKGLRGIRSKRTTFLKYKKESLKIRVLKIKNYVLIDLIYTLDLNYQGSKQCQSLALLDIALERTLYFQRFNQCHIATGAVV